MNPLRVSIITAALAVGLLATACTSSTDETTLPPDDSIEAPEATAEPTTTTSATADAEESPPETTEVEPPVLEIEGAPILSLVTVSGGGTRPVFEWEPIDGADFYVVYVHTESGEPYWSGRTSDTQLPMGGAVTPEEASGPRIADGYTWSVYAFDATGLLIATSEARTVSP